MEWWDFIALMVGDAEFNKNECGKCHISFSDYQKAGVPHTPSVCIPYGTLDTRYYPVLCERCYARFIIMIAEWLRVP